MKTIVITLLVFALLGCGGDTKPKVNIPPDADLKADVMIRGLGETRSIEVSFYFSKPVAPGDKTQQNIELIPMDDVKFNDQPLTPETNQAGRNIYTAQAVTVKPENVVTAKLNGKQYETRAIPQTNIPNKSVTAVMTPK